MILLFTDFGTDGPYLGQMTAVLAREAPGVPVIPLFSDAPAFDPRASAYLLAAYTREFPAGTVILGVVDPGVGSPRKPLAVQAGGRWYGPRQRPLRPGGTGRARQPGLGDHLAARAPFGLVPRPRSLRPGCGPSGARGRAAGTRAQR